jgi:hypothetical protein
MDPYSDGPPYRHVAWAGIRGWFGKSPQLRTYQFMVRRLPRCLRDDGSVVSGIKVRGSNDASHPNYWQANPAAVVWEVLTNKLWGRGLSSDMLDEASFIAASQYYAAKNIGVSVVMDHPDSVGELLAGLYHQVRLLLLWDGLQYKCKCLLDRTVTHAQILTIRESQVVGLKVTIPTWDAGVVNELRAEYTSAERGYRPDVVHVQDLAGVNVAGGRLSGDRVSLVAIAHGETARQQAQRLLMDVSMPWATLEMEVQRSLARVEPGDCIRLIMDRVPGETTTTYWIVTKVTEGDPSRETITLTAVQDTLLPPVDTEETTVTVPGVDLWERITPAAQSAVAPAAPPLLDTPPLDPVFVVEMPPILARGEARAIVQGERLQGWVTDIGVAWSADRNTWIELGVEPAMAVTGILETDLSGTWLLDRQDGIIVRLKTPSLWMGDVISAVNEVPTPQDHAWKVLLSGRNWLVIEDEWIQVGYAEAVDSQRVRFRCVIRGRAGSKVRAHQSGAPVLFLQMVGAGVDGAQIPIMQPAWWKASPYGVGGRLVGPATETGTQHPDPYDSMWLAMGRRPLPPEVVNVSVSGGSVTVQARPRFTTRGGGVQHTLDAMGAPVQDLGGLAFAVQQLDSDGTLLDAVPMSVSATFTPGTMSSPAVVSMTFGKKAGAVLARIYSQRDGLLSVDWTEVAI